MRYGDPTDPNPHLRGGKLRPSLANIPAPDFDGELWRDLYYARHDSQPWRSVQPALFAALLHINRITTRRKP